MPVADTALIHPKAHVEDSDVGAWAKVWQFASVIRGAIICDHAQISSGALVDGSYIGERSIVGQNVAMGAGFVVGDDCFIGPNVVLCNDAWPRAAKAGFAGYIAATAFGTDYQRKRAATIVIGNGSSIGANATILPGLILGENSMVAAGSVCDCNVPANHVFVKKGDIRPISEATEVQRLETRMRNAQYREPAMETEWQGT